jgi:glycosyltransferase involved in cell wall biosynthesis
VGTLVQPGDPADLARGIEHTFRNWPSLQRDAVAARPRIEAAFGWAEVAARTQDVYRHVLQRRQR